MQRFERRQDFLNRYFLNLSARLQDSLLIFHVDNRRENAFSLTHEQLSALGPARDAVGDQLTQRNAGHGSGFSIGTALAQAASAVNGPTKRREAPLRLQVIPSRAEVTILKVLWTEQHATGAAIYARLDSLRLTASDVQAILNEMAERGLLQRQQISPRNEFTIATPFGAIPIEMSRQNRQNREYMYQPAVGRQAMWRFLDATLFSLQAQGASGPTDPVIQHLRDLLSLIAATRKN